MLLLNDLAEEGYDWAEIAAAAVSLVQHTQADTIFTRRPDRGERSERRPQQSAPRSGSGVVGLSRSRERASRTR